VPDVNVGRDTFNVMPNSSPLLCNTVTVECSDIRSKMQSWNMQEWKSREQIAGQENAGVEKSGADRRDGKCRS